MIAGSRLRPRNALAALLEHDLRLGWRDFRSTFRALDDRALAVLLAVLVLVMHAAALPIARGFDALAAGDGASARDGAVGAVAFLLLLMTAQTVNGVTKLLYTRGDLDLLLSSPVPPPAVLVVRALAVAAGAFASAAIFVVPLADAGALTGGPHWLACYPALVGGALLAAAFGLGIALGLFALIGPRRTRLAAQILATVIGAAFMLGFQLRRFLAPGPGGGLGSALDGTGWGGAVLGLPVRAGLGDPAALAVWLLVCGASFAAACMVFGGRFARFASQVTSGQPRRAMRLSRPAAAGDDAALDLRPFRSGALASLRGKEWRLIARDPWLVSQILLQVLYMTPMIVVLWSGSGSAALALAPMMVVVAFQVASSLTWLGLSGEDAPELLATAPVPGALLRRGKLEAVGVLTAALVAAPILWLSWRSPAVAAATLGLSGCGLVVAVTLQLWHGRPARRSAFAARHRESKLVALIEMVFSMLFGVGTALVVLGSAWSLVPLGIILAVLGVMRPRRGRAAA